MWDSSSRPSCARPATAPWMWGWSSRPPPLASGVGLLLPAATPGLGLKGVGYLLSAAPLDLGRGVAPLGHSCAITVWHSQLLSLNLDLG